MSERVSTRIFCVKADDCDDVCMLVLRLHGDIRPEHIQYACELLAQEDNVIPIDIGVTVTPGWSQVDADVHADAVSVPMRLEPDERPRWGLAGTFLVRGFRPPVDFDVQPVAANDNGTPIFSFHHAAAVLSSPGFVDNVTAPCVIEFHRVGHHDGSVEVLADAVAASLL